MEGSSHGRNFNAVNREERYLNILRKREQNASIQRARQSRVSNLEVIQEESNQIEIEHNFEMAEQNDLLEGLDATVRARVDQLVAQKLADANKIIKVTNVNTCIELPKYVSANMTSATYFKKIRSYFTAQGYESSRFHELLPMVLKGEFRLWYDSVCSSINSWEDFCEKFKIRYDSERVQIERSRLLHTKRQSVHDPSEQFIMEMINLAKQVNPQESDAISLKRVRDALLPEIGKFVGDLSVWTLDNLLDRVGSVHDMIERENRMRGNRFIQLPPLSGLKKKENDFDKSKGFNSHHFNNRENYFGSRDSFNNRGNFNSSSNYGFNQEEKSEWVNSNKSQAFNNNQSSNRGQFRGNSNRGGFMSSIKCRRCQKYGHYASDCRTPGIVMSAIGNSQNFNEHDSNQNFEENLNFHDFQENSLNFQREY